MSWKDAEDGLSDACTAEFGEPVRHVPMLRADVNGRAAVDPARPTQMLQGIFDNQHHDVFLSKGHDSTRAVPATHTSSRNPMLYLETRDLVSVVRVDDRFALLDRFQIYEVADVQPDGQGRIALKLTQLGRPQESL